MAKDFGANAFEEEKAAKKLAEVKEQMSIPVDVFTAADGKDYPVTPMDIMSSQFRQMATNGLRILSPDDFKKYREMKYAGGGNPDLATRKAAYIFAATRFIELSYSIPGC